MAVNRSGLRQFVQNVADFGSTVGPWASCATMSQRQLLTDRASTMVAEVAGKLKNAHNRPRRSPQPLQPSPTSSSRPRVHGELAPQWRRSRMRWTASSTTVLQAGAHLVARFLRAGTDRGSAAMAWYLIHGRLRAARPRRSPQRHIDGPGCCRASGSTLSIWSRRARTHSPSRHRRTGSRSVPRRSDRTR